MLTFGQKIKNARRVKGLTQKELARLIGAKHNSVSNWEADHNKPDPDTIELLCGALDISPNYLFSLGDSPSDMSTPETEEEAVLLRSYRVIAPYKPLKDMVDATIKSALALIPSQSQKAKAAPAEAEAELEVYPGEPMSKHRDLSAITIQRTVAADQGGGMIVTMTPEQQKAFLAEARRLEEEDRKKAEEERSG